MAGVRLSEAQSRATEFLDLISRSAFTVCSQACFDTAAQKKAQTLHDPHRRDMLATD